MQYNFTQISLAEDARGQKYVKTTAVKAGDPGDRGFGLPFFNPEIISQVERCISEGITPEFSFNAEIEEVVVPLGAVYFRRATDPVSGKILDAYAVEADGKPRPQRKMTVHTIFQYSMHDAYYVSGEKKGMRIMEQSYTADGKPIMVPAKQFDLDDLGRPIKLYMRNWAPEERRDQILATFYKLAPAEYQQQTAAPIAAPTPEQPAQTLQSAAQSLFGPAPGQPAPQPAPQAAPQPQVQQPQANAVDPLQQ